MKTIVRLFAFSLIFLINTVFAQPTIEWQRCLGGSNNLGELGYSILKTANSGLVLAGYAGSNDGDVSGNHSNDNSDFWIVCLDSNRSFLWQKCYGGTQGDYGYSIDGTQDGGYIFAGNTGSNDGDVIGNHGNSDVWVIKMNSVGGVQWKKCFGGTRGEFCYSIKQTNDGGYLFAGTTASNDGQVSGNHGNQIQNEIWVVKISPTGAIQWQKCLGGTGNDVAYSVLQTNDGGYLVGGYTDSNDGDVTGNHGNSDAWVIKLSSTGAIQWQKCLGGTGFDGVEGSSSSIQQALDGGYIITGVTYSNDGDANGHHGGGDVWVIKISSTGAIQWQKCLGGTLGDRGNSIQQTSDGGFIIAGSTYSNDGDISSNHGGGDAWVVKLNSTGAIQWEKCMGGSGIEQAFSIIETGNNNFTFIGYSRSNDGDVIGNHGQIDMWAVNLGTITETPSPIKNYSKIQISPNPTISGVSLKAETSMLGKSFRLFNAQGRAILTGQIMSEEMPLSIESIPAGIYSLWLEGQTNQSARLVKE